MKQLNLGHVSDLSLNYLFTHGEMASDVYSLQLVLQRTRRFIRRLGQYSRYELWFERILSNPNTDEGNWIRTHLICNPRNIRWHEVAREPLLISPMLAPDSRETYLVLLFSVNLSILLHLLHSRREIYALPDAA